MIRRDDGELVAECADCGAAHYVDALEFAELVNDLMAHGWRITKDDREWVHLCQECREEQR